MTRAQECIMMLEELLKSSEATMPYRPNCTELNNVSPESFEFVIRRAITLLNKYDPDWAKEIRGEA